MVEISLLEAKYASAGPITGVKCKPQQASKLNEQSDFLKPGTSLLRRGIEIDLLLLKVEDFKVIVRNLKSPDITVLRLYNRANDFEPVRFRPTEAMASTLLQNFLRVLAHALGAGGWLQHLELGFKLWKPQIKVLSQSLSCSSSLRHISFANSGLGDCRLQLLAQGLWECLPLQILDLSGCALTDASSMPLTSILKAAERRNATAEWQSSLRESGRTISKRRGTRFTGRGLTALNLAFNFLSDATSRQLYDVTQFGNTLEALNLQGNRLQRKSAQLFLSVYETWGLLRLVDLRNNLEGKDIGVLEEGKHLHCFSKSYAPFWNFSSSPPIYEDKGKSRSSPLISDSSYQGTSNKSLPCTPEVLTKEPSDHQAIEGWGHGGDGGLSTEQTSPREFSPRRRESEPEVENHPVPNGNDQASGHDLIDPFIPSIEVMGEHCQLDQMSCVSLNGGGSQISASPILDVHEEYPHLLENTDRMSGGEDLCGDLSPLYPKREHSDQFRDNARGSLSPLLNPAIPQLTGRPHLGVVSGRKPHERPGVLVQVLPGELVLASCQPARQSYGDVKCEQMLGSEDILRPPCISKGSQPKKQNLGNSKQIQVKQSRSKDHKRPPPRKLGTKMHLIVGKQWAQGESSLKERSSRELLADAKRKAAKQTTRSSQSYRVHSGSDRQTSLREELEWGTFLGGMAKTLIHLQERLNVLIEPE